MCALGEPSGPMLKGMTYSVRPRMQPSNKPRSVARISRGGTQLFVGPASALLALQMKVRSSTRATSPGSERARKLPGRRAGSSRVKVPDATSPAHSASYSACEPSHQWTRSGRQSAAISATQARSRAPVSTARDGVPASIASPFSQLPPRKPSRGAAIRVCRDTSCARPAPLRTGTPHLQPVFARGPDPCGRDPGPSKVTIAPPRGV